MNYSKRIYHAAMYLRLSQEDGDVSNAKKAESNSISTQKAMIKQFLKDKDDIILVSERVDDGYTGSNFDRPQFQLMIEDIRRGVVDCVIVKDLSRFGREYIDSGNYLERIFPALGVRFIAITDNVDSINDQQNDLLISFKNLLNDSYCRDISIKIRSSLEAKRKDGKVVSSFLPYGYMKDPNDKYKAIIDEEAAMVVREIYKLKLNGMSINRIAIHLENKKIPSPYTYKRLKGLNFSNPFAKNDNCPWNPSTVRFILTNRIYVGDLIQGKITTPNHKVKKHYVKPENEWTVCKDNHEPIIGKREFDLVQRLLGMDTRTSPYEEVVYPLSGLVICPDCGLGMVKKNIPVAGREYHYYLCNTNKKTKKCSSHRIRQEKLESIVLKVIQTFIENILDIQRILKYLKDVPLQEIDIKEIEKKKELKIKELRRCKEHRNLLYEDLKDGTVSQEEYNELYESYNKRARNAEEMIRTYEHEIRDIIENRSDKFKWIDYFAEYQNIQELTRIAAIELIDKIIVHDKNKVEVVFNFDDMYQQLIYALEKQGEITGVDENGRIQLATGEFSDETKI
ncbi:recombinase family protein [Butyrivibrio sp. VCB2006]|jgi:DNA invertase Pin-like site-specific DNA recombinase|uniref:recombinase family protein n=1 Tax=Butyrivibrio sp. VCB2006 TaxID=1280679 RepID=UPI000416955C|nr:recombinase family protein [Butyrivibrio sp. VCB2006]